MELAIGGPFASLVAGTVALAGGVGIVRDRYRARRERTREAYVSGTRTGTVLLALKWLLLSYLVGFLALGLVAVLFQDRTLSRLAFIVAFGTLALPSLAGVVGGWLDGRTWKQVETLTADPSPDDVPEIVDLLDHDDDDVRADAVSALEDLGEPTEDVLVANATVAAAELVDRLCDLLDHPAEETRRDAARALGNVATAHPEPVLDRVERIAEAYDDHDPGVRRQVVGVLAVLASADEVPTPDRFVAGFRKAAADDHPAVRAAAANGASQLDGRDGERVLARLRDDDSEAVRRAVVRAVRARGRRGTVTADWERRLVEGQGDASGDGSDGTTGTATSAGSDGTTGTASGRDASRTTDDGGGSAGEGAASDAEFVRPPPDADFGDIAGMAELKDRLREEVVAPFEDAEVFEAYGVGAQDAALLHGPPGTGKTHVATCLAGELGVNFLPIEVSDLTSRYVGAGVERVEQLEREALDHRPCLVFIDEIDAVAGDRGETEKRDDRKTVDQLLMTLSTLEDADGVLVVAATNDLDAVDDGILRTGRFNARIEVPPPDAETRLAVFDHHLDAPRGDIDREELARSTEGFVASDMRELARRTARRAAVRAREGEPNARVTDEDVEAVVEELAAERSDLGEFVRRPPALDFDDIAGMEELKDRLRERVIRPLERPEEYEEFGIDVTRGVLLYGPPGTGKTHVATCLAGELGVNYVEANAADLVSKFIGESATNVGRLFEEARAHQPCLVFVDEVDALATTRGRGQQQSERQMINQFLDELSTIHDGDDDVVVVAATNRPEDVDDAMLRSGRLGEQIEVPPPDARSRVAIFDATMTAPRGEIDRRAVAELTEGMVASDVEAVAEAAARRALRRKRDTGTNGRVTTADVEAAVEDVRGTASAYD